MQDTPETRYQLALRLVQQLDDCLSQGYHYRTTTGRLITTLDQTVLAIEQNQLAPLFALLSADNRGSRLTGDCDEIDH